LGTGGKQVLRYARLFGWPGIFHTFVSDINDLPGEGIEERGDNSAGISVNNAELLGSPVQEPTCLAPHAAVSPQTPSAIGVVIDYLCCLHLTVIKRP
jgi:hypothetical protein